MPATHSHVNVAKDVRAKSKYYDSPVWNEGIPNCVNGGIRSKNIPLCHQILDEHQSVLVGSPL